MLMVAVSWSRGSRGYTGWAIALASSDTVTPHCASTPKGIWLSGGFAPVITVVNEPPPGSVTARCSYSGGGGPVSHEVLKPTENCAVAPGSRSAGGPC